MIELEDEVQEFEQSQDTGTRQILSVQVDVSDVRFLRPSTRLVLAVNSMDVGRREGARGVIDTAARYTVAGRAWDHASAHHGLPTGLSHKMCNTREKQRVANLSEPVVVVIVVEWLHYSKRITIDEKR